MFEVTAENKKKYPHVMAHKYFDGRDNTKAALSRMIGAGALHYKTIFKFLEKKGWF